MSALVVIINLHAVFDHFNKMRSLLSRRYEKTKLSGRPLRSKNLFSYCRSMFGWFWEVGGHRKKSLHRCALSFSYLDKRNVKKPPKSFFDFLTLVICHRFFFVVPETQNPFFFEIQKDAHRNLDRNPRRQKLIWSIMVPFGVKSDPSF